MCFRFLSLPLVILSSPVLVISSTSTPVSISVNASCSHFFISCPQYVYFVQLSLCQIIAVTTLWKCAVVCSWASVFSRNGFFLSLVLVFSVVVLGYLALLCFWFLFSYKLPVKFPVCLQSADLHLGSLLSTTTNHNNISLCCFTKSDIQKRWR